MMNKNIEVKVVSMKNSIDRRYYINELMKKYKIDYSFFDAINGRESCTKEYYNKAKNSHFMFNRKFFLTPSEYGCMSSHLLILKNFVANSSKEWLIVLEDDIIYDEMFNDFIKNFIFSQLNKNKVYILGGQEGLKSKHLLFGKNETINEYKFKNIYSFCNRWVYRTCCYLVNKESAKMMLEVYQNFNIVADDWSFICKKSNIEGLVLLDIIKHPEDLKNSLIEKERA